MEGKVTKQFVEDFNYCMEYYGVTGDELEFEKQRCRDNLEEAKRCYASIANELRHFKSIGNLNNK
jgi:hypothetical protein